MVNEKRRRTVPEMLDRTAGLLGVYILPKFVYEKDIQIFCVGCSRLDDTGMCSRGTWHQERAVVQKLCHHAKKDDEMGKMTKDGFTKD
jgi:hypothetical protein